MNKISNLELGILITLTVLFPFLATNFNTNLGTIYSLFTLASIIYLILDPQRDIPFKNPSNSWITSVLVAGVAVVAFMLLSTYAIIPGTKSLLNLLASSTPVLANNPLTNKIVFGVLVATAETLFFFVYLFDLIASMARIKIEPRNLKSMKLWSIIIGISLVFMFFHLTAKISGSPEDTTSTLVVVFFMGIFSMLLVTLRGQAVDSILYHIFLNSLAIGLIAFTILQGIGLG